MLFGLASLAGCATTPWSLPSSSQVDSATSDTEPTPAAPTLSSSQADAQSLQQVMSELQQVGATDPAARDKLMADLKRVDPGLWPTVLQAFRTDAEYRRREAECEAVKPKEEIAATVAPKEDPGMAAAAAGEHETRLVLKSAIAQPLLGSLSVPEATGGAGELPSDIAAAPQPNSRSTENAEKRPALLPEPQVIGGIDASPTTAATPAERTDAVSANSAEALSVAARLAAIRSEASAGDDNVPAHTAAAVDGAAPISESDWQAHLAAALRSIKQPDSGQRAAETKRILGETLAQLGESAPLAVRNLTFCTEVARFGSFDALKSTEFTAGQKVLLYAEVDNLHIEASRGGYHWAVKVNGRIFDSHGKRMADYGWTFCEERYQTPRHDFFVSKLYYLPRLVAGRYNLQFTVEDTLGHKVGRASIDFTVKRQ